MERREFVQKSILTTAAIASAGLASAQQRPAASKEIYDFRVYHMRRNINPLDNFFSKALIPALNKMGVKNVGVFRETSLSEPAKIYTLTSYASFEDFGKVATALNNDKDFITASADYNGIAMQQAVYERFDSSLLLAFDGHPKLVLPSKDQKLFELRIYEGYSEDAVKRKVKMFNQGEIDIFRDVKLPAVFYGENISGKNMPALTYMGAYNTMEERDQVWKNFSAHPEWQKMSKLPEYADTVSKIYKIFLERVTSSQI